MRGVLLMGGNMKRNSQPHEEQVTKLVKCIYENAYNVNNSGAPDFKCGDVAFRDGLIECKTKDKKTKTQNIEKVWFNKLEEELFSKNKSIGAIAIDFGDRKGDNYFIINELDFLDLLLGYKKAVDKGLI